jgi:hypothetical protein
LHGRGIAVLLRAAQYRSCASSLRRRKHPRLATRAPRHTCKSDQLQRTPAARRRAQRSAHCAFASCSDVDVHRKTGGPGKKEETQGPPSRAAQPIKQREHLRKTGGAAPDGVERRARSIDAHRASVAPTAWRATPLEPAAHPVRGPMHQPRGCSRCANAKNRAPSLTGADGAFTAVPVVHSYGMN